MTTERRFDLVETMRFDSEEGIVELERHLARMKRSAEVLHFAFDRHHARNELQAASFGLRASRMLKLRLSRTGAIAIEARPLPEPPEEPVAVAAAPLAVEPNDVRLAHETSDRTFLDEARQQGGTFEIVFIDPEGFVTKGSFTTVFVPRDRVLLTPPRSRAPLPGVLREALIDAGRAREADLRLEDLASGFYIGNAVRGLIAARLAGA